METAVCHRDRTSRAMLARAKSNLVEEYAFVGIMEVVCSLARACSLVAYTTHQSPLTTHHSPHLPLTTFVGVMKEMKQNFKILAKIFPSYFGAKDMPLDICNKCKVTCGVW